jgi:hypothetical protein
VKSDEESEIWSSFVAALEKAQAKPDDPVSRRSFAIRYRSELVLISFWLNQLRMAGGIPVRAIDPPHSCNLCGVDLAAAGLFIDGQITDGRWSFMCMPCYARIGVGIGWGIGQLFRFAGKDEEGEPVWFCIAGGPPTEIGDDPSPHA